MEVGREEVSADTPEDARATRKWIGSKLGSVSIKDCPTLDLFESGHRSVAGTPNLLEEYPLPTREPLGRYAGAHRNLPVLTAELPSAGTMPPIAKQRQIRRDLVRWLRNHLSRADIASSQVAASPT